MKIFFLNFLSLSYSASDAFTASFLRCQLLPVKYHRGTQIWWLYSFSPHLAATSRKICLSHNHFPSFKASLPSCTYLLMSKFRWNTGKHVPCLHIHATSFSFDIFFFFKNLCLCFLELIRFCSFSLAYLRKVYTCLCKEWEGKFFAWDEKLCRLQCHTCQLHEHEFLAEKVSLSHWHCCVWDMWVRISVVCDDSKNISSMNMIWRIMVEAITQFSKESGEVVVWKFMP